MVDLGETSTCGVRATLNQGLEAASGCLNRFVVDHKDPERCDGAATPHSFGDRAAISFSQENDDDDTSNVPTSAAPGK